MTFFVNGSPVGKQSVRVANHHSFIPKKTRDYMIKVANAFIAGGNEFIPGAVELTISEYRQRPKYHYGTGKNAGVIKEPCRYIHCVTKPDLSNVLKAVEDALNGLAWKDDCYVVDTRHSKRYANPGERVGLFVTIEPATMNDNGDALPMEHRQPLTPPRSL